MKVSVLLLVAVASACAQAQQGPDVPTVTSPSAASNPNPLVTLASEFFEHDYFNIYAFGDGVVDTNNPIITNNGSVRNSIGYGFDVGGGINAAHAFRDAQLTLSYNGAYRDYQSGFYSSGTSQNLGFGYYKRLSRHLSMNIGVSGGIFLYGGSFFTQPSAGETAAVSNPFSPETKFVGGGIGFNYQQTRRLSYSFGGNYFISRYNYPGSIGAEGGGGSAAVNYRLTARTTLSGNYSRSYFVYQRNAGSAFVDTFGATLSHGFSHHWSASAFGGYSRSVSSGTVELPVTFLIGNQAVGGYLIGRYRQVAYIPTFSGTVSHAWRHSLLSISGGEGVSGAGNGYFLASRNLYLYGVMSYSWHGQNFSAGGGITHLKSVANTVAYDYNSSGFSASYGRMLVRYVGFFLRYDFTHYGTLAPYNGVSDNRFAFGFNFSSKSVPLTLF